MKKLVLILIRARAKAIIKKFHPIVIAVTGSVGKTSTRNAIFQVLSEHYTARTAEKNFNNEFGVPLTILGEKSPGRSPFGWLAILWRSFFVKEYPHLLVLEYGIDHPGDMKALCEIAQPNIAIVTAISPVHVEYFGSIEKLADEKATILEFLPEDGLAILNADDERVMNMKSKSKARVITYGMHSGDYGAREIRLLTKRDDHFAPGDLFAVTTAYVQKDYGVVGELVLQNVLGYAGVLSALAAIAVADHFDVPIMDVIKTLNNKIYAAPGRLNPIAGVKGSLIIDDSYNAAPAAMANGLKILKQFEPGEEFDRRIAALGQMAELGEYAQDEHRMIGMRVSEAADVFVAVGERMKFAVDAAREAGMKDDQVFWFPDSKEAGRFLDGFVQEGDIVYVKGSQSSRMEHVVKDIMADPLRAKELLVRQDDAWLL